MTRLRHLLLLTAVLTTQTAVFHSSVRAADRHYVPDDADLVLTVNVKQILACELLKGHRDALVPAREMLDQFAGFPSIHRYLKGAGVEVFRDLDRITFACLRSEDPKGSFVIAHGSLDPAKVKAGAERAKANGDTVQVDRLAGATVYEISSSAQPRLHATQVNASTLIVTTSKQALATLLTRKANDAPAREKKAFKSFLEASKDQKSIRLTATGAGLAKLMEGIALPNAELARSFLKSIEAVSVEIILTGEVEFQVAGSCASEDTAKKLSASLSRTVQILLTLVQQKAKENTRLVPLIDIVKSFRISQRDSTIRLHGAASLDAIEQLTKNFKVRK